MSFVDYTLAMPDPCSHLYHITIEARGLVGEHADFIMPSWTPGSYLMREFARHVQEFAALDGLSDAQLVWRKADKNTWRVDVPPSRIVRVSYKVYAFELTVRTSHLDADHGYFNGANLFMYVDQMRRLPVRLKIDRPQGWRVSIGLSVDDELDTYFADDYDHLIDCPGEVGSHRVYPFDVLGRPHRLAIWGHGNEDPSRLIDHLAAIIEAAGGILGELPYEHYLFLLHLIDRRGGGLEHRNSNTSGFRRFDFVDKRSYQEVLIVLAHEFFHVWNVKRIRPAAFDTLEYRSEVYTRLLWVMEGVTTYYAPRLLRRAGLMGEDRYLEHVGQEYVRLLQTPGQNLQSIEEASFDAWIKHYRPDESTQNTAVSYYEKGSLVATLLDMELRLKTQGSRCLDDVLRHVWHEYTERGLGLPEDGFQAVCEEVAGDSLSDFFDRYVRGTASLPFAEYLDRIGLTLTLGHKNSQSGDTHPIGLGLRLREDRGRLTVHTVFADGPAARADVCAGDEVVALDGYRIDLAGLRQRIDERSPGDAVRLHLFRRDELRSVTITLGDWPYNRATIRRNPDADAEQVKISRSWLAG